MKVVVSKYHGAGNDFLIIDNREGEIELTQEQIAHLCHRRFGIGADGVLFLNSSKEHDFEMAYYNSDGKIGSMCGNGGRSLVAFAADKGITSFNFLASDGLHEAKIMGKKGSLYDIELKMSDVSTVKEHSPKSFFLDTGSPHLVLFVNNLEQYDVDSEGRMWRQNPLFKGGTNVNFVEGDWSKDIARWGAPSHSLLSFEISIRTYERGVEAETLACGTGVVASTLAYHQLLNKYRTLHQGGELFYPLEISSIVKAMGGTLQVRALYMGNNNYRDIWLRGPATSVFETEISL